MNEPPLPDRPIADAREIGADLRYRWNQARATGDAEALARVYELAKRTGVSQAQLDQITDGFVAIAQELISKHGEKKRRGPFQWRRRKHVAASDDQQQIDPRRRPLELPPGEPD